MRVMTPSCPSVRKLIQYGRQLSLRAVLKVFSPAACIRVASEDLNTVCVSVKAIELLYENLSHMCSMVRVFTLTQKCMD